MAQFCIDIADEDVERVITALCETYGRPAMVDNPDYDPSEPEDPDSNPREIPNPETPNEFANRIVRKFISEVTVIRHDVFTLTCDPLDCYTLLEGSNLPAEMLIAQIIYTESAL